MNTPPQQLSTADARYGEIVTEILTLLQSYINSGESDPNMRNAILGIQMWTNSLQAGLQHALLGR